MAPGAPAVTIAASMQLLFLAGTPLSNMQSLNDCMATLVCGRPAASSSPDMYGKDFPWMSPPGRELACTARGPKYTAMSTYRRNTYRSPHAVTVTSTWIWWAPCLHQKDSPTCLLSWTGLPTGLKQYILPPPQQQTLRMLCIRNG
jgi:hypothetical protein